MPVDDSLAGKDPEELTEAEAQVLARQRSEVSLEEYNPSELHPADQVVELLDGKSVILRDLTEDEALKDRYPLLAQDAQDAVDERFPGTAANGPGSAVQRAADNSSDAPADQPADQPVALAQPADAPAADAPAGEPA